VHGRDARATALAAFLLFMNSSALAAPSQEDVFKSISKNVGDTPDTGRLLLVLVITTLVVVCLVMLSQRHKRKLSPKPLNHPRKLIKEVTRQIDMNPREVKRLKAIAEEMGYSSPLVLMLCPSLLKEKKK
jgi:hypothetical protein